jgi:ubiquinone/menaquinone biosynthesis C-methylase UbiE
MTGQQEHWNKIYSTKRPDEFSWTQEFPKTSIDFIHSANLKKTASIIDIGGGDSRLIDVLLDEGFENISVLDISEQALLRARERLGDKAKKVNWIVCDVTNFHPAHSYDLWHDRATFHFLTTEPQIAKYLSTARQAIKVDGFLTIGTFSKDGPRKCSGLYVKQYDEKTLAIELKNGFERIRCVTENHITPFNTTQNFLFCSFKRCHNEASIKPAG